MSKETATSDELNKDKNGKTPSINSEDEKQQPEDNDLSLAEENEAKDKNQPSAMEEITEPFPMAKEENDAPEKMESNMTANELNDASDDRTGQEDKSLPKDGQSEDTDQETKPKDTEQPSDVVAESDDILSDKLNEEEDKLAIETEPTNESSDEQPDSPVEKIESNNIIKDKPTEEPEHTADTSASAANEAHQETLDGINESPETTEDEQIAEGSKGKNEVESELSEAAKGEIQEVSSETTANAQEGETGVLPTEQVDQERDELLKANYASFSKEELVKTIEKLSKLDDFKLVDEVLKLINPFFLSLKNEDKKSALDKFIAEGGEKDDFAYKDSLDHRYDANYKLIKDRKNKYYGDLGKQKLDNYEKANELLEKLRELVDGEESTSSISAVKAIQTEWKAIGQVPPQHVRNLWASYNALMDRYYDHRSIYFELKELDRKKNLKAKEALITRAEKLEEIDSLKDAIRELNDLHNEYKHIGPVPKANQEAMWQRFKAASDKVYARRKTYYEGLKHELDANFELKAKLRDEVQPYQSFNSDRIVEWNNKTKEILDVQKRWEAIGGVPKERASEVNKPFWSAFKAFFNHKNAFFKNLESQREGNMKLKEALIEKAIALKESDDWNQAANDLKKLQQDWKNIGPVPEKFRNEIYQRFKEACDYFFERRRNRFKEVEKEYEVNLEKKNEICDKISSLAKEGQGNIEQLEELQEAWNAVGFVPKNAIRSSQVKFAEAVDLFISKSNLDEGDKEKLKITTKLNSLKGTPNANRKLNKKEFTLRKQITNLENDITLWKNNLEFFANSKNADQVRLEFDKKIEDANDQLEALKEQLRIIKNI